MPRLSLTVSCPMQISLLLGGVEPGRDTANDGCARRASGSEVHARRTLCRRWRRLVDLPRHGLINADRFRRPGVRAGICRANLEAGLAGFTGVDIVRARWDAGVAIP